MSDKAIAHLVFLRRGSVLLVKRPDVDWRQLQDEYDDYMASLGPWCCADIVECCATDYSDDDGRWPFRRSAIEKFMQTPDLIELDSSDLEQL